MADRTDDVEFHELQRRLEEAEETLRAIRDGEVDALVVGGPGGDRIFTLHGADRAYRVLIEAMQQGAVSLGSDGTILYCNRYFADMVKLDQARVIGAAVFDFFPAVECEHFETVFRQAQTHKARSEFQIETTDGSLVPVDVSLAPLPLGEAEAVCMIVIDQSEQKKHLELQEAHREKERALALLRDGEQFVQRILAASPGLVYLFDLYSGRTVFINQRVETTLHVTPEQVMADDRFMVDRIHPDDLPTFHDHLREIASLADGDLLSTEYRIRHANGRWVWFASRDVVFTRDSDGNPSQILGVATDITERKRAEREREDTRQTFESLVERCPFGIYIVDADFRIAVINKGSQLGMFANVYPIIGRRFDEAIHIIWPESVATEIVRIFRHTLDTGEAYCSTEFINQRADTDQTEGYEWELHQMTMPDGRLGVVCYYYDSTQLRQIEQELREAHQKKDEFLSILAHELRNPLAPIRNGLQLMKLARTDAHAIEQARSMMERQVGQMVHLIDDLMDLTRISQGKIVLQKTRLPISTAVRNAVETSCPLVQAAGHELTLDVPGNAIYVNADETRLSQVFANLLNNAAKYTENGGRIRVSVQQLGHEVIVAVEDNGVGIPTLMLPKVFEMFTQVDRSLEKSRGGLGIGLSIVKRLVEMHGGTVIAESGSHGTGSRFVVRLPVFPSLVSDQPVHETDKGAKPATLRRILVADDNRDAANSLAMLLRVMGNETQTAYDGCEAVKLAAVFQPDIVLLDIGMPRMNGLDACRHIRGQSWGADAVLVACTGWGQECDKQLSKEAGFDFHMVKPVDPAALEKILIELEATTA